MIYGVFFSISVMVSGFLLFGGIISALVSLSLVGLWLGMEMNFLGAVAIMAGLSVEETESVIKYFIIQVVGSSILILAIMMLISACLMLLTESLILLSLMVKLGVFPFHFWIPSVMATLSWMGCFVVSVFQKIVPIWMMSSMSISSSLSFMVEVCAGITGLLGCLGGLSMLHFRVLLSYSSLIHLGFMVILCMVNISLFMVYLLIYSILNMGLMMGLWSTSTYSFLDIMNFSSRTQEQQLFWVSLYLFSLAGVPPLTGCFLKMLFLNSCWVMFPLGCVILVLSSMVSLFFYIGFFLCLTVPLSQSAFLKSSNGTLWGVLGIMSVVLNLVLGYMMFISVGLM
uniref:NADH-ubiquinone oxidoreductase chain 2 n=1 Tax=Arctica islandica TaxID=59239 RepID=U5L3Y4_ARCIS|nr:NADH dehydrogenase subunit 2 [Arctica islandica]